jgi:hypothetical protein
MIFVVILLAPTSVVAVANCGGHGALLATSSAVPTCVCDPGYSPKESDGGVCVPDSDVPGSWAAVFTRVDHESAQERVLALLWKTPNQTLSVSPE